MYEMSIGRSGTWAKFRIRINSFTILLCIYTYKTSDKTILCTRKKRKTISIYSVSLSLLGERTHIPSNVQILISGEESNKQVFDVRQISSSSSSLSLFCLSIQFVDNVFLCVILATSVRASSIPRPFHIHINLLNRQRVAFSKQQQRKKHQQEKNFSRKICWFLYRSLSGVGGAVTHPANSKWSPANSHLSLFSHCLFVCLFSCLFDLLFVCILWLWMCTACLLCNVAVIFYVVFAPKKTTTTTRKEEAPW